MRSAASDVGSGTGCPDSDHAELELSDTELVIVRDELDRLHDDLYVLACAVDDVDRDLAAGTKPSAATMRELLEWLLEAARPLRDRELSAPTGPGQ